MFLSLVKSQLVICHCFTNRPVALAQLNSYQPILIQIQETENWFLTRQITVKRFCVLFNQPGLMESQPFSFLITYILNKFSIS